MPTLRTIASRRSPADTRTGTALSCLEIKLNEDPYTIDIDMLSTLLQALKRHLRLRYINPMDIPLALSGNFMEPRNNHFHSGLDMRTGGVEGVPVRAVADGWVSRIKISPWGYGKAVYIEHKDGHTTVYGHLSALTGAVGAACADAQYRAKDFTIDQYLEKNALPLEQGEVFALSGNSGGSGGPHLHFEIRDGAQNALDPEVLGIKVKDTTPPEIMGIRLYPLTDSSRIGPYPARSLGFPAQGTGGRYGLKPGDVPMRTVQLGWRSYTDRYDGSSAKFGVRMIDLYVDSVKAFSVHFDQSTQHTRYAMPTWMEYTRPARWNTTAATSFRTISWPFMGRKKCKDSLPPCPASNSISGSLSPMRTGTFLNWRSCCWVLLLPKALPGRSPRR